MAPPVAASAVPGEGGCALVDAELTAGDANDLIERLGAHWTEGIARELVYRLVVALECRRPTDVSAGEFGIQFSLDLSRIYLGGLGERVGCLVAGGRDEEPAREVSRFWQQFGTAGGVVVVFCVNDGAYAHAVHRLPPRFALALAPDDVAHLLASLQPRRWLAERLATRLGRAFMSVYDISKPATVAFFGRTRELDRLTEDAATSYAITGPGRIGKSSLLKRYTSSLKRRFDPRATRLVTIDCTDLPLDDPNAVARRVATRIRPSNRSQRVTATDLMAFLRECRPASGPIELLIDEADEFCFTEPFRQIGQATREGSVRLVICGRKSVHDYALRESSPLARRLELIRLGPLHDSEARDLIVLPMADLGITVDEDPSVVRRILDRTGRLPHLIHYYCKHIVAAVSTATTERDGASGVTHALLTAVEQEYDFLEHVLNPLFELRDSRTYEVAIGLLGEGQDHFRLADVEAVSTRLGHSLSSREAKDLCDELVIQNVLVWDKSAYRVSSPMLRTSAHRSGLLRLP